jgi:hypothetical protein
VRNISRCGTVHGQPESVFTITGIRNQLHRIPRLCHAHNQQLCCVVIADLKVSARLQKNKAYGPSLWLRLIVKNVDEAVPMDYI